MKEVLKGVFENLTDEQKEKAKACKDMDEFMKLAGEWGIELPDEVADAVAGGGFFDIEWDKIFKYKSGETRWWW